jgi:hypothetical protein
MAKCELAVVRRSAVKLRSWGSKFCYKESVVHVREAAYVGNLAENPL